MLIPSVATVADSFFPGGETLGILALTVNVVASVF